MRKKALGFTHVKRHRLRSNTQGLRGTQATATIEEAMSSSSRPGSGVNTQRKSDASSPNPPESPQAAMDTTTAPAGTSDARPHKRAKGRKGGERKKRNSSQAPVSIMHPQNDQVASLARELVQFMMHMYKMEKPATKEDMLKMIGDKYKGQFPEILKLASHSIEVVFGVDVKTVDSNNDSYVLVSKMNLPNNGAVYRTNEFPKTGLLMNILGVIFMSGNRAAEQVIWDFLNKMKIYAGRKHFLFGEPKKLLTQDLVKLKYLKYQKVSGSDPPCYEFLWGSRSHAEISKMEVLQFMAKINHTTPSAFHMWYEKALQDKRGPKPAAPPTSRKAKAKFAVSG